MTQQLRQFIINILSRLQEAEILLRGIDTKQLTNIIDILQQKGR